MRESEKDRVAVLIEELHTLDGCNRFIEIENELADIADTALQAGDHDLAVRIAVDAQMFVPGL